MAGLLRWGEALDDLQALAAEGSFGRDLRLRQIGRDWQLVASIPEVAQFGRPQLSGRLLSLGTLEFEGVPMLINGTPSDSDPPPTIELSESELQGPTTIIYTIGRGTGGEWEQPAQVSVVPGLFSGGTSNILASVVALIVGGSVLAGVASAED